jgi:hypothetical protein
VSDVLHRMIEIDPPFRHNAAQHREPSMSLNAFRANENDSFDRAVLDGGGFQAGGKSSPN